MFFFVFLFGIFWNFLFGKSSTKIGNLCTPTYKFIWPAGFLALDKTAGGGGGIGGGEEKIYKKYSFFSTTGTEEYSFTVGNGHVLKIPCIKNPIL